MTLKANISFFYLVIVLLMLEGCSVIMSLHGKKDADFLVLTIGQKRDVVVKKLGEPEKTSTQDGIREDIYQVQRGNSPDPGRALGHAALDAITLGAWELIGTPVEGLQGKSYIVKTKYDENDNLIYCTIVEGQLEKMKKEKSTNKDGP